MKAMYRSLWRQLVLLVATVMLLSCGGIPSIKPNDDQRLEAAKYALDKYFTFQQVINRCLSMTSETREIAQEVGDDWLLGNSVFVVVADKVYADYMSEQQAKYGKQTGLLEGLRFAYELQLRADKVVREIERHDTLRDKNCRQHMKEYYKTRGQMTDNRQQFAYLQYIFEHEGADSAPDSLDAGLEILQFDTPYRIVQPEISKSWYQAEKIATDTICADYEMFLLLQKGPREDLGIYCADGQNHILSCVWGQCSELTGE